MKVIRLQKGTWEKCTVIYSEGDFYKARCQIEIQNRLRWQILANQKLLVIYQEGSLEGAEVLYLPLTFQLKIGSTNNSNCIHLVLNGASLHIYFQTQNQAQPLFKLLSMHLNQLQVHSNFNSIRTLWKGSSSSVFQVMRFKDETIFAAKSFCKKLVFNHPYERENFINEVTILRKLRKLASPNFLQLVGVFESDNSLYLITQKLQFSLYDKRKLFPMCLNEVRSIMQSLLEGIAELHSHGIIHRDIKLENIMFRTWPKSVLIDFGLSVEQAEGSKVYRCGSPGYVAPEMLQLKCKRATTKVDIFSLGVVFHVLLTGQLAFYGATQEETLQKNKSGFLNYTDKLYASLDQNAVNLLELMLQVHPHQRLSAAEALRHNFFVDPFYEFKSTNNTQSTSYVQ